MNGITSIFLASIIIGLPVIAILVMANRFFRYREKRLEVEARSAAEKAAQYASRSMELEQRVRVLEQIVTDGGAQTAQQIEALREHSRIERTTEPANDDAAWTDEACHHIRAARQGMG
jgi:hypothetical protein